MTRKTSQNILKAIHKTLSLSKIFWKRQQFAKPPTVRLILTAVKLRRDTTDLPEPVKIEVSNNTSVVLLLPIRITVYY